MSKRICSNCRYAIQDVPEMFCLFRKLHTQDGLFKDCHCFFPKSFFDRITASPEVLAEKLVFDCGDKEGDGYRVWYSSITQMYYFAEYEAIAATVARLKEVAE